MLERKSAKGSPRLGEKAATGLCAYRSADRLRDARLKADGVTPTEIAGRLGIGRGGVIAMKTVGEDNGADRLRKPVRAMNPSPTT
jgi:hypothetical protein